jgi:hypothetical protein
LVKDESCDVLVDSCNIFNKWKNYLCQLSTVLVHGVNDVRQAEVDNIEPLVPEPRSFEVQIAVETFGRCTCKSPGYCSNYGRSDPNRR